jgi:hypothetical protein
MSSLDTGDPLFPYFYAPECAAGTEALGVPLRLENTGGGVMCLVADFPETGYQILVIDSGDGLTCSRDPDNYPFGRPTGWIASISNAEKYGANDDLITIRAGCDEMAPADLATLLRGLLAAAAAAGHHPHPPTTAPASRSCYHWSTAQSALYQIVDAASAPTDWHTAAPRGPQPAVESLALGLFAADGDGLIVEAETLAELSGFAHQAADHVDSCDATLQRRHEARADLCTALAHLTELREQITAAEMHDLASLPDLEAREPDVMQAVVEAARILLSRTIHG